MRGEEISVKELKRRYEAGLEKTTDPLQIGDARYIDLSEPYRSINHSCTPNAYIRHQNDLVALRGIRVGEEVTIDYSATDWPNQRYWSGYSGFWAMECHCGSSKCRKKVTSWLFLPEWLQQKYIAEKRVQDYVLRKYKKGAEVIREHDKKRIVFSEKRDLEILNRLYRLERRPLNKEEKVVVKLIWSQLEGDWRRPLLQFLASLERSRPNMDEVS